MSTFKLILQDSMHIEEFDSVVSFVGEDASGQFGIKAHHARMMTVLVIGLARFCDSNQQWRYVAVPGAILYFRNNVLTLSTRRFLVDDDYLRVSLILKEQVLNEEKELRSIRKSLRQMEEKMLKLMWGME